MTQFDQLLNMLDPDNKFRGIEGDLAKVLGKYQRSDEMSHTPYTNPLGGLPEVLANHLYSRPGDMAQAIGNYASKWGPNHGEQFKGTVDSQTGVNEMGFNPENIEASPKVQSMARLLTDMGLEGVAGAVPGIVRKGASNLMQPNTISSGMGGRQAGVLDTGESLSLPEAMAMDEASRMQRAGELGHADEDWYHATTHDFDEFGGGNYERGGHFGGADYLTNNTDDASRNYAGEGPDLTQRIQMRAEQLAGELDLDYDDPGVLAQAKKELKGPNEGVIMPLRTRVKNTFSPDDSNKYLSNNDPEIDINDFADEDEYYDALYTQEPEGPLQDFIESIQSQADEHGFDAEPVIMQLQEASYDGGVSFKQLDEIMRNTEWYAEDYNTGELINNDVYKNAIKDAGFDSIRMDATAPGWNMDIEPGTEHLIVLDPKLIRSKFAKFDPAKKNSANILASGLLGATGLNYLNEE